MEGGEATNPVKMEALLYASLCPWGTEEEDNIYFLDWKVVGDYQYPVDPNSLSFKSTAMFPEVEIFLNSCV